MFQTRKVQEAKVFSVVTYARNFCFKIFFWLRFVICLDTDIFGKLKLALL